MSITKDTAQTESQTNHSALTTAANNRFIAAADQQITDAIAQGRFSVDCISIDDIDPSFIGQYYSNLGYQVALPDYPQNLLLQQGPSNLFGEFWINFWSMGFVPQRLQKPYRFLISWNP